jgi:hypothetical protein
MVTMRVKEHPASTVVIYTGGTYTGGTYDVVSPVYGIIGLEGGATLNAQASGSTFRPHVCPIPYV